jgi:acyl-coenzyme A synthetase/AMP-(fatty) acid ligase
MTDTPPPSKHIVYWHRDLPPVTAEVMDDHVVEAVSGRVQGTLSHRDELWDRCYEQLMAAAQARIEQEVQRLNGDYAHVHDESIDSKHEDATGETWLHGRFNYVLFREGPKQKD